MFLWELSFYSKMVSFMSVNYIDAPPSGMAIYPKKTFRLLFVVLQVFAILKTIYIFLYFFFLQTMKEGACKFEIPIYSSDIFPKFPQIYPSS